MADEEFLRCPECGCIMILQTSENGRFYGCSNFPKCRGTRAWEEGFGKITGSANTDGKCKRCGQYDDLSEMKLCSYCQERFDRD